MAPFLRSLSRLFAVELVFQKHDAVCRVESCVFSPWVLNVFVLNVFGANAVVGVPTDVAGVRDEQTPHCDHLNVHLNTYPLT